MLRHCLGTFSYNNKTNSLTFYAYVKCMFKESFGRKPWSSGYGRRLIFWRLWVWIPAPYSGWTFFTFIWCKIVLMFVWKRPKINEKDAGMAYLKTGTLFFWNEVNKILHENPSTYSAYLKLLIIVTHCLMLLIGSGHWNLAHVRWQLRKIPCTSMELSDHSRKSSSVRNLWTVQGIFDHEFFGHWLKMPPTVLGDGQKTVLGGRR